MGQVSDGVSQSGIFQRDSALFPISREAASSVGRILLVLAYLACYHWSYAAYVNPTWEYGHYYYFNRDFEFHLAFYLLAIIPLFFYSPVRSPANLGAVLIFLLSYAPGQLTVLFMWTGSTSSLLAVGAMLAVGMCMLFLAARLPGEVTLLNRKERPIKPVSMGVGVRIFMLAFSIISLAILIVENRGHMRLVSFYDVYALRAEAGRAASGGFSGYLVIWISLLVIPFYSVRGILERNGWMFLMAVGMSLLVYMSNGAKIALLMPFAILAMAMLYLRRGDILIKLCASLTVALALLMLIDQEFVNMAKAILIARTLSVGGWTIAIYHEYFVARELTYFGHIGFVNEIFNNYPYGQYALGQIIGINYSGSSEANFNAGFWASDGIAAIGISGVIVVSIAVAALFIFLNMVAARFDERMVSLWLTGFWVTLMNAPFTTALLSGGGLLVIMFLLLSKLERSVAVRWPGISSEFFSVGRGIRS